MRTRLFAVAAAVMSTQACHDATSPGEVRPANAVDVIVQFCNTSPTWIAVKNDGYEWTVVPTSIAATGYRLSVTPKVIFAYGTTFPFSSTFSDVHVLYLTADELAAMVCGPPRGEDIVSAPVAGAATTDYVSGVIGPGPGVWTPSSQTMSFYAVPGGLQDLVASRRATVSTAPIKYIVRHNVPIADFATLPALDFASSEAVSPFPVTITAPGGLSAGAVYITNRGAVLGLPSHPIVQDSAVMDLLPASSLASGDGFAVSVSSTTRAATRYFATPAPQTITFGPALSTPTITTLTAAPTLLLRAELPSQPEYPSAVTATYSQISTSFKSISVTVSAGYLGATPATWTLDVPDLTTFLSADLLLAPGAATTWTVSASDARMPLFFSRFGANDGETVRSAKATGPVP